MSRRAYQEVQTLVEEMNGLMKWVMRRAGFRGTWVICIENNIGIFPYDNSQGGYYPVLDDLYQPNKCLELRADAKERLLRLLE
jgi:hypothetical protein